MGAINNAFNQATGAVAGAALAIKHAKETDFSKMVSAEHSALIARNQSREADVAADEARLEEKQAMGNLSSALDKNWDKEQEYQKAKERKNASPKTVAKKLTERDAAARAVTELTNKLNGIYDTIDRAKEQRAYAERASQIASKAQQKYQSKWGIK